MRLVSVASGWEVDPMKLVYMTYNKGDAWTNSEAQMFHNALRSQAEWFAFDINRAWVDGPDHDYEDEQRVWRGNRHVLVQADCVVCIVQPDWTSPHLPWEVGFCASANIPCIVITTNDRGEFKNKPPQCGIFNSAHSAFQAMMTVPKRERTTPELVAKWRRIEHDTKNEELFVEPSQAHHDDAGFDLTYDGHQPIVLKPGEVKDIPCGVAVEWPPNTWGLLVGRSSTFRNRGLLCNPAIIDPGYRGHLFAIVRNVAHEEHTVQPGERVAQIVPLPALAPQIGMVHSEEHSPSTRGEKGLGSSGL